MGTRPIPTPLPVGYRKLNSMKTTHLKLVPFGNLEITKLIMKTIGVKTPPPQSLIDLLKDTTSGNPFFAVCEQSIIFFIIFLKY